MDRSDWKDTPLLSQLEVLEVLDAQSQVLKAQVLPHGAANTVSLHLLQALLCLCDCAALCQHVFTDQVAVLCIHAVLLPSQAACESHSRDMAADLHDAWSRHTCLPCLCNPLVHVKECLLVISAAWSSPNGHARQYVSIVKSLRVVHCLSVSMVLCICTPTDACPAMLATCGSHVVAHACMHCLGGTHWVCRHCE